MSDDQPLDAHDRKILRDLIKEVLKPKIYWLITGLFVGIESTLMYVGIVQIGIIPNTGPVVPIDFIYGGIIMFTLSTTISIWYQRRGPGFEKVTEFYSKQKERHDEYKEEWDDSND